MQKGNEQYVAIAHEGASPWWSWPILKHPIVLWHDESRADEGVSHIFLEGNPVLWWAVLIALGALGAAALALARLRDRLRAERNALLIVLAGYLINFLPFIFISRILFLYSYFPAFIFSLALAVIGIGSLMGWMQRDDETPWRFPTRRSAQLYWGIASLVVASFLYFAPLTYGTPVSRSAFDRRMWLLERH